MRAEDDPDIAPYVHEKQIEFIKCEKGGDTLIDTARKVTCISLFLSSSIIPILYAVQQLSLALPLSLTLSLTLILPSSSSPMRLSETYV